MENLGLGVMINMLGGNDSAEVFMSAKGKTIAELQVDSEFNHNDGGLKITFTDGTGIVVYDAGRSCCESRYMMCEDDLSYHVGATLENIELREWTRTDEDYDTCEVQFVNIFTSKGVIEVKTYNNHNGYYGGFYITVASL